MPGHASPQLAVPPPPARTVQPLAAPQETPECEGSTCHGISVHDPVYHHDTWWNWVGLIGLAVLVVGAVGFMVGRIIAL